MCARVVPPARGEETSRVRVLFRRFVYFRLHSFPLRAEDVVSLAAPPGTAIFVFVVHLSPPTLLSMLFVLSLPWGSTAVLLTIQE